MRRQLIAVSCLVPFLCAAIAAAEPILDNLLPIPNANLYTGHLAKYSLNGIIVHTYASDEAYRDWTILFESGDSLVMLEPQTMPASARDLRRYVDDLDKPLAGILVSYHGVGPESYPGVPIYATRAADAFIRDGRAATAMADFAEKFPEFDAKIILPTMILDAGLATVGGIDFLIKPDDAAYPMPGMDVTLPGHKIHYLHMLAGDMHSIVSDLNSIDPFVASLENLKADGIRYYLCSHHMPETVADVDAKVSYLQTLKAVAGRVKTGAEFVAEMKRLAPDKGGDQYLGMTAAALFK